MTTLPFRSWDNLAESRRLCRWSHSNLNCVSGVPQRSRRGELQPGPPRLALPWAPPPAPVQDAASVGLLVGAPNSAAL